MKKILVIMAAGIGSRFGGGIKQIEPVGPNGEIIMDYSVHDAIKAGFKKVVFIIRHDIEKDFREIIGNRIEAFCEPLGVEVSYAFQELKDAGEYLPDSVSGMTKDEILATRTKPFGTGHAILACDGLLDGPFAVINADDYYGKDGFIKAAKFLDGMAGAPCDGSAPAAGQAPCDGNAPAAGQAQYGLVGYILKNTLSDNGGVTRGICIVEDGNLVGINETKDIVKVPGDSEEKIGVESNGRAIDADSLVSMNFWCYPAEFMEVLKTGFPKFLSGMTDPMKDEYLLPTIVDEMIQQGTKVAVIPTDAEWFGVTYKEDKEAVVESFKNLYAEGAYNTDLYSDLQ